MRDVQGIGDGDAPEPVALGPGREGDAAVALVRDAMLDVGEQRAQQQGERDSLRLYLEHGGGGGGAS